MYKGPWFIYVLTDPRKPDEVRYVGWTKNPEFKSKVSASLKKYHSGICEKV